MRAYLDASAILPILIEEAGTSAMDGYMVGRSQDLVVSDFAAAEVASGLSRLVGMAQLSPEIGRQRLANFDDWRAAETVTLELVSADARQASSLVRRFDLMLRAPAALHVAICRRTGDQLITLDRRLADAARALGLDVLTPA